MEKNIYQKLVDDVKGICFGGNNRATMVSVESKYQTAAHDESSNCTWGKLEFNHQTKACTSSGMNSGDRRMAERRSGFERRVFAYDICIPERRSGLDRRSGIDRRKSAA